MLLLTVEVKTPDATKLKFCGKRPPKHIWFILEVRRFSQQNTFSDQRHIDHVNSFPVFQSYYKIKDNPNRKYFNPNLIIRKMYLLYVEKCKTENKIMVGQRKILLQYI